MENHELYQLTTESINNATTDIDLMRPIEFVQAMNKEDAKVAAAVEKVLPQIARAIEVGIECFHAGGRLIYTGAGTSGRLGILDAVECFPTFGADGERVIGLIAGGRQAVFTAVEGAEDSFEDGAKDLEEIALTKNDFVIGIAASGRTPYVLGALDYAAGCGCKTAAVCCNTASQVGKAADIAIEPVTGPELLTGSTRLKCGSAQKMVLNMISTGIMVGLGKTYRNLMVDLQPSNEKLKARANNMLCQAAGLNTETASQRLAAAGGDLKLAIAAELYQCSIEEARRHLESRKGKLRTGEEAEV